MPSRGCLITFEGIDGAGKSTLAEGVLQALRDRGVEAVLLREPGGVEASERVRALVKDPDLAVTPRAEALLYAAARAQLVEEALRPQLAAGSWVLLDRFVDSSLAYQGGGRELGVSAVRDLNRFATGGLEADRTLLLWLEPGLARLRADGRAGSPDRLEREDDAFFARITETYARLAAAEPARIKLIDASLPPAAVLSKALVALDDLLTG